MTAILIIVGRFLIGAYFAQAGIRNFLKTPMHTDILRQKGIPMPRESLWVALAVQTLGGLMVALGILPAIGAIGLIAFTIVANYLYHNFTQFTGDERERHMNQVLGNVAVVGGLVLVVAGG